VNLGKIVVSDKIPS